MQTYPGEDYDINCPVCANPMETQDASFRAGPTLTNSTHCRCETCDAEFTLEDGQFRMLDAGDAALGSTFECAECSSSLPDSHLPSICVSCLKNRQKRRRITHLPVEQDSLFE